MPSSSHGRREQSAPRRRRRRAPRYNPIMVIAFAVVVIVVALTLNRLNFQDKPEDTPSPSPSESASPSVTPAPEGTDTPEPSPTVDTTAWNLRLVNTSHPLPDDFTVEVTQLRSGHAIDSRAYPELQQMMDDARAAGVSPLICSSFRTMDKQKQLFQKQVDSYVNRGYSQSDAEVQAAVWVAIPGTSEHQLGLAVDIVDESYQMLDKKQETTPAQQWLMAHCQDYGFILRYPTDKSGITGIGYEPWHYRYVGKEAAQEIMSRGICLEEYLGETN